MTDYTLSHFTAKEDVEEYFELMRQVFVGESVDAIAKRLMDKHQKMSFRNFFVLRYGSRMVASLNLIPQTWSLGCVSLRVA